MLNLSHYSKKSGDVPSLETVDHRHYSPPTKIRLPRHIATLETPQRCQAYCAKSLATGSNCTNNQQQYRTEAINLAVSILDYQLKNGAAQQKHLENLRSNLQHRWEVAKANQNSQLMMMLQHEFRQLETSVWSNCQKSCQQNLLKL
ncbi:MAG: hypothetical protein AAFO76_07485 [Cyanobacteria bacterium J06607_15]